MILFARKLHPLEPVLVYGRSYKADPPCQACESLWWGWKDLGRPADRSRNREPTASIHPPTPISLESLPPWNIRQNGIWPTRWLMPLPFHALTCPPIHTIRDRGNEALIHLYIERSIHCRS